MAILDEIIDKDKPVNVAQGNGIKIIIQSEIEGKVYGSHADTVKAILLLLDCIDFKYDEEHKAGTIDKYILQMLDKIGDVIQRESHILEEDRYSNVQIVKEFLDDFK
jgi:hypothetical protein